MTGTVAERARTRAHRAPTMADVAARAGVSPQTVSRVMRGHPNVAEITRFQVEQAISELGYRRAGLARALITGRTMTLGVVSLESNSFSRSAYLAGMTSAARSRGYYVAAATATSTAPEAVSDAVEHLRQQGVDGVVIAVPVWNPQSISDATNQLPTVIVCPERASDELDASEVNTVWIDQRMAGRLATEHLLELGHRTVWHIAGPPGWADAAERQAGWSATLASARIAEPPVLIGDWSAESGYKLGTVLARMDEVTAVFAASDDMAFGALTALLEHGRRVPEDVSVVGMDDIALSRFASVPLTTVHQPFREMGAAAIDMLVDMLEQPESPHDPLVVTPELVVRKSSGPHPETQDEGRN